MVSLDSAVTNVTQEGGGVSSSNNMRTRLNDLESRLINIGILASTSVTSSCDASSAKHAINTKGTGANTGRVVSVSSATNESDATFECSLDDDADGIAESSQSSTIMLGGTLSVSSGRGGSTTATIRQQTTPDSASSDIDWDSDNDGVAECSLKEKANSTGTHTILSGHSGSTTGTIRMAATPDSTVFDLGYSGSTTGTIRMQASSVPGTDAIVHSSGAVLTSGGVWTNASDENLKENFKSVDGEQLLDKIEELPISQWNYKNESDEITHIGPTAQDFREVFGVGKNDKTISTIDPSGIALAAIKQLSKENGELKAQVAELRMMVFELAKKK
jgi:hypothetical protein